MRVKRRRFQSIGKHLNKLSQFISNPENEVEMRNEESDYNNYNQAVVSIRHRDNSMEYPDTG